jgi:hypothetical protein
MLDQKTDGIGARAISSEQPARQEKKRSSETNPLLQNEAQRIGDGIGCSRCEGRLVGASVGLRPQPRRRPAHCVIESRERL